MKAILLAAGCGKRLEPFTKENPKPMILLKGRPIIGYILDNLIELVEEFIIVIGYKGEKLREYIGENYRGIPVKYIINPIYETTNSTYSLWLAKSFVGNDFFVINADTIFHKDIIKRLANADCEIAMAIDDSSEGINKKDAMRVTIIDGFLKDADKKIPIEKTHGDAIGIYKFKNKGCEKLFEELDNLVNTNVLNNLFTLAVKNIMQKNKVYPISTQNLPWTEIDDYEDLNSAEKIIEKIGILNENINNFKKMKAAVYVGDSKIEIKEIPVPEIEDNEILLKVTLVGLCKTDVKKILYNMFPPPRIFGHEIVGKIEKIGKKIITNLKEGDRVVVFHHVPCLDCFYCRNENYSQCSTYREIDTTAGYGEKSGGGFAEYIKIPELVVERGLIKIPENVADEEAVFVEPLNCCLKAIKKANLHRGDSVLIIGQGSIGLALTQLARLYGAKKIITTDLYTFKSELSEKLGADFSFKTNDPKLSDKIRGCNEGNFPNKCFIAVESLDAVKQGLNLVSPGGEIIFVFDKIAEKNLSIDPNIISNKEIDIIGSYSSDYSLHEETANLIFNKKIKSKDMITHIFSLEELPKAIDMAIFSEKSIKILIKHNQ